MLRRLLTNKITRERLRTFLAQHATQQQVFDVGASQNTLADLFPNTITGDIRFLNTLDLQYDAHAIPLVNNSVDVILCTEVLEHCHAPHKVIDEFYRILRPNGKLILTTRFVFPIHDAPHDYFRFTEYGLKHLCQAFTTTIVQPEVGTLETLSVLLQRLIFQTDWKLPLVKIIFGVLARILLQFQRFIKAEYGDISKTQPQKTIMTSGYYVIAIK
jgi:ubiquinone/menaquinone biosynthesis C-methylase UbiE